MISARGRNVKIAMLENGLLVGFQVESKDADFVVGDIILGKIRKRINNLNAAFVDLNNRKDGFLHFDDIGDHYRYLVSFCNDIRVGKNVKLSSLKIDDEDQDDKTAAVEDGQEVLVQITKEPLFNKGPRLTCDLTLAGKYLVLSLFTNGVFVSKRITDAKKRETLSSIVTEIRDESRLNNFGIILRTSGDELLVHNSNEKVKDILIDDLLQLLKKWSKGLIVLKNARVGDKVIEEDNRVLTVVRDKLSQPFDIVWVDDEKLYSRLKSDFGKEYTNKSLRLYNDSDFDLFSYRKITLQLKLLMNKRVSIANGGYLIIEKTEAMNVIDVNSGHGDAESDDHEDMVFSTNMNAAKEIVRQILLRDMGGIIAIDFIDMTSQAHRNEVYDAMRDYMEDDRPNSNILPLSSLNVMLISRQKLRSVIEVDSDEKCPMCKGRGKVEPILLTADILEKHIMGVVSQSKFNRYTVYLHPFLVAYFSRGIISKRLKWSLKTMNMIILCDDCNLMIHNAKIVNSKDSCNIGSGWHINKKLLALAVFGFVICALYETYVYRPKTLKGVGPTCSNCFGIWVPKVNK